MENIDMTAVMLELEKLNKEHNSPSFERISIQYESKYCFNLNIIDTPGFPFDTDSDEFSQVFSFCYLKLPIILWHLERSFLRSNN